MPKTNKLDFVSGSIPMLVFKVARDTIWGAIVIFETNIGMDLVQDFGGHHLGWDSCPSTTLEVFPC